MGPAQSSQSLAQLQTPNPSSVPSRGLAECSRGSLEQGGELDGHSQLQYSKSPQRSRLLPLGSSALEVGTQTHPKKEHKRSRCLTRKPRDRPVHSHSSVCSQTGSCLHQFLDESRSPGLRTVPSTGGVTFYFMWPMSYFKPWV